MYVWWRSLDTNQEGGNHTGHDQDGNGKPDPFDDFFSVFFEKKTHK